VRYQYFGDTYLSIVRPSEFNQLCLLSDAGRLLVPLFCANKFDKLFPFLGAHLSKQKIRSEIDVEKDNRNQQDIKQTRALIEHLPWEMLLKEGFIEYIDNEERESVLVAMDPADFYRRSQLKYGGLAFTHLEILPTLILGVCSSQIPFCEHNQAPRKLLSSCPCDRCAHTTVQHNTV
jgi:DNA-directed RNA polymerase II subunit RPB2